MIAIDLYTKCKKLEEQSLSDLIADQGDITQLFPKNPERVKLVGTSGGSRMADSRPPDTWHFKVASASIDGHRYNVYVRFKNIKEEIKTGVGDKDNWKNDGTGVDHRKLAEDILANVDIEVGCSCPADLYWGFKYVRSRGGKDSNYGPPETRAPRVRNPREHGAYCKHIQLMLQTLPFYKGDFAKFLMKFYNVEIGDAEKGMKKKDEKPEKEKKEVVKPEKKEPERDEEPKKNKEEKEVEPKKEEPKRKIGEKPKEETEEEEEK
jgi:hypothetical protein